MCTFAATTVETVVAIIGVLVPLVIAILNTLKKQQYARAVNSLWEALQESAVFARGSGDPDAQDADPEREKLEMLSAAPEGQYPLYKFVHAVISDYQRGMSPGEQKAKGLGGNGDWMKTFEKVLEKRLP